MEVFCPDCVSNIYTGLVKTDTDLVKCGNCGSVHESGDLIRFSDENLKDSKLLLPAGSKITFKDSGNCSFEFMLPPAGITGKAVPFLIFSFVWLFLLIFWTVIAIRQSLSYLMFSVPFWLVAFWILIQAFNSFREMQIINLDREFFTLRKLRPVKSAIFKIGVDEIVSIRLENYRLSGYFKNLHLKGNENTYHEKNHSFVPVISFGINKESFFENSSAAEHRWLAGMLNRIIFKLKSETILSHN